MDRRRLESELAGAVAKEKERNDVDTMKKRAITTAKSYDEFKNMVACASLKPLNRVDFATKAVVSANRGVGGGGSSVGAGSYFDDDAPRSTGADAAAARAAAGALASRGGATASGGPVIRSPGEFEREWRRLPKDASARLQFVVSTIGPDKLATIFRSEIDSMLLSDIISNLKAGLSAGDAALAPLGGSAPASLLAARCLLALSKATMWSLAAGFLTDGEKDSVSAILKPAVDAAAADTPIAEGVTREEVESLAQQVGKAYGLK